ncbi:MAG TPA: tetratricopeptide repeat protein [Blastocatellia bacterium]|nr:tetratricopeptide repeat protein [Blastocatellia bacterium]
MKLLGPSAFLLLAPLTLPAAAQTEQVFPGKAQSGPSAIEQAESLLEAGKIDAAISVLTAIPRSESNETQISHLLGLAYYQKADYASAVGHLSVSTKRAPEGSRQYRQDVQMLGLSHYLLGHIKEAIPYLEQVKNWAPDNVEMAYTLGVSYIQTHDVDKARESFARMFSIPPDSASAYLINAQMMIRQQFEEFAEKELQKTLELDPKLPQANFLLGEMAIYRANLEQGIAFLKKEIAINPGFAMAYYMLGEAYTRQLKWEEAVAPLQQSIWLNPFFSGPYIVLGKVYLKKGEHGNAEGILRRALKMDPNNFSGHYLLAQVLQRTNRAEAAKKEFEIADSLRSSEKK